DPAAAARGFGWLHAHRRMRTASLERPPAAEAAEAHLNGSWERLFDALAEHGVPLVPSRIVDSADEVRAAVAELGVPVAVKLPADEVEHKTEQGGVRLGLATADDAVSAFRELAALPG